MTEGQRYEPPEAEQEEFRRRLDDVILWALRQVHKRRVRMSASPSPGGWTAGSGD